MVSICPFKNNFLIISAEFTFNRSAKSPKVISPFTLIIFIPSSSITAGPASTVFTTKSVLLPFFFLCFLFFLSTTSTISSSSSSKVIGRFFLCCLSFPLFTLGAFFSSFSSALLNLE